MDRNCYLDNIEITQAKSLSARRAWIEITERPVESRSNMSLSARRAWIEMDWASVITAMTSVALRKESVDRNRVLAWKLTVYPSRSPQGERG